MPVPEPLSDMASREEIERVLALAKAEGRDITDTEFLRLLGFGTSAGERKLAISTVRAYYEAYPRTDETLPRVLAALNATTLDEAIVNLERERAEHRRLEAAYADRQQEVVVREVDEVGQLIAGAQAEGRSVDAVAARTFYTQFGFEAFKKHIDALTRVPTKGKYR
jgi:hypothetical protein